jgi:hypothetical protein
MKPGKFNKPLEMKKITIANLNKNEMNVLRGGTGSFPHCPPSQIYNCPHNSSGC